MKEVIAYKEGDGPQEKAPPADHQAELEGVKWTKYGVFVNAVLAVVGITGLVYAWKSVQAARDNAAAALHGVKATIKAQRPWIVVSVEQTAAHQLTFTATNQGETLAKLTFYSFDTTVVPQGHPWGGPVRPATQAKMFGAQSILLPPKASYPIRCFHLADLRGSQSEEEWLRSYEQGFRSVYSHGLIVYRDVVEGLPP